MPFELFGFQIGKKEDEKPSVRSFAPPSNDDGAIAVTEGGAYGTTLDLDGAVKNESQLITRYREMALQPECQRAIDDIVNESMVSDENELPVNVNLDETKLPNTIKKRITEEFEYVLKLLNFNDRSYDVFKNWYVDGRLYYHIMIDEKSPRAGIQELRYIDPRKIRKVREIKKDKDPKTGADVIKSIAEYYVYSDKGTTTQTYGASVNSGLRIATDSVINVNSGLMDAKNTFVISYLHKAIKPLNQLRMIEDAVVIYRLSRAPERRIFYIDVGNLPRGKAEQYLKDIMIKYRNKMVYDANTGELRDDRKHLSMLEDFWLPRREGGKGTEITTLPAGQNLGELEDVKYFRQKLLQSLNVPISRLEPQQGGMIGLGRTTEVTRDEVKFLKFIIRLRNKFSQIFDHALRIQCVLKGICTSEEWEEFKDQIYYDYKKDNNFTELRDAELLTSRLQTLTAVDPFVGRYYSAEWVRKNVLQQTDDDIKEINKQIKKEEQSGVGGPTNQEPPQVSPEQYPPEDNTQENDASESMTPMLDAEIERYSSILNRR